MGARNDGADHAIRVVGGLTFISGGSEVGAKEGAIKEGVLVVTTGRAHTVGAAGVRIKRTACTVAHRCDIEPVMAWHQGDVQLRRLRREKSDALPERRSPGLYLRQQS